MRRHRDTWTTQTPQFCNSRNLIVTLRLWLSVRLSQIVRLGHRLHSPMDWHYAACMKAIFPVSSAAILLLVGCGDGGTASTQGTNSASSGNPITAPVDYLEAVGNAKQRAVKTIDVTSLTQAVQLFQVSEGRLPKDLNELVTMQYIARIPDAPYGQKIVYNSTNGVVTVVPQ